MRRVALATLAVLSACGQTVQGEPGPLEAFYRPSGLAVHDGKLVVASSNFDLLYRSEDGGSVIAVDPGVTPTPPAGAALLGGINVESFTGDLAVAEPARCPGLAQPIALVASRATPTLYPIPLDGRGAPTCDGCGRSLQAASYTDPFGVGIACGAGVARAYVGYLRTADGSGWLTEYDLVTGALRSASLGFGPVRGFAFDAVSGRLWMTGLATGSPTSLRWIDVRPGCTLDGSGGQPACSWSTVPISDIPYQAIELHGIALANESAPGQGPASRRVYLTGRVYDAAAAANAGGRTVDLGGRLLVGDLVDDGAGGVHLHVVNDLWIGNGAADVRVLPPRSSGGTPIRDAVVAVAQDEGVVWVYDDEAGVMVARFDRDLLGTGATGAPETGHTPFAIAVDPVATATAAGDAARVYVGSFGDSWVTPIDVPLDAPANATVGARITGGTK